jgi:cell surface protein SprA
MIGIRNPKKQSLYDGDDMNAKSVEVWVNELRLLGFNDKTGFAALVRSRVNLADLGDVTLSGTFQTPGFGSLEQSVTERSQETVYALDVATNLEGGKLLFPQKWNIKIPFHYDYSFNMSVPEYNPLNPDVKLKNDLKEYEKKERDSIRRMTTAMIQRQNINLMNVRKERNLEGPIKIRPWDVENLDFSYSYAEVKSRDVDVEFDNKYHHEGQIGYTLNHNPKNIRPLQKAKFLKSKWLQIIRDFNFTPLPKAFTFRTSVIRELNEFKLRPKSQGNILIDTSYVKSFDWTRNYTLNWDLTQGLRFDYTANAAARIEEPQGLIDTRVKKDSVWRSFGQGGRTTQFGQRFNATYQIPINKIPAFKFINAQVRYAGTFDYNAPPLSLAYLGGTIQNSSNISGNVNLNFVTLYNAMPYLKRMNQSIKPKVVKENEKKKKEFGKTPQTQAADNRDSSEEEASAENTKNKQEKEKKHIGKWIGNGAVRFLMMVRNFSVNYTQGNGTVLPGYMNTPKLLGMSLNKKGAPGFLFVFGAQPNHTNEEFRLNAGRNNWLSDSMMTTAFQKNGNNSWNFRSNVEPFKDFRIDISATRTKTEQYQDYFEYDRTLEQIKSYSARLTGNFSMSFLGLGTFFADGDKLFDQFKAVRLQLAQRIAANNHADGYSPAADSTGFPSGYNMVQQDVLIASFLATYGGRNADKVDISTPFLKIPLPNWRLNYNGFTKIKGINKIFSSFSLIHNYTSNYQIGNYTTNINYKEDHDGNAIARDLSGNFIPSQEISQIQISQNFGPFVGFDMTMVNGLTLKLEYKKRRDVALSFTNNQINENSSDEFVVNAGYRFKDIKIGFVFSGMKRQVVSDLNLLAGVGIKDNKTVLRKLAINPKDEISQVSAGLLGITINISANYQLSQMVGIRFYYDHQINRPHITGANNYDNMNFDCGIAVTLMLTQ